MATAYVASIEEELTCSVCFELFVDPHTPKDLRCPHVICELCLNRLVKDSAIDCPLCHTVTRVSKDGVTALRTNLGMRNLAVTHQKHLHEKKNKGYLSSTQSRHDGTVPVCSDHDNQTLDLYCITCDVLACQVCVLLHHECSEHQTKDVNTIYDERVKKMDAVMNRLANEATLCEKKSQELCETEQKMMSSIKKEVDKIDKAVELMVANAYKESNALKTELENLRDIKLKECSRQKLTLQKQAHVLRRAVTDTKSIERETSSHNYVILHKALTDKLKTLEGQSINEELVQYTPGELKFKRAEQLSVKLGKIAQAGGKAFVQQLVRKKKITTKDMIRKIHVSATLATSVHNETSSNSLALNRTADILVTSDGGDKVCVFRKQEGGGYRETFLKLSEHTNHTHVAMAPDDSFLICQGQYIYAYSAAGQNLRMLHRINIHVFEGKLCDSVNMVKEIKFTTTDDGRIVVGANKPFLKLLTPDGKVIKTISTANINPKCITAINNTHVAITDSQHNVGVFDLESNEEYSQFRIIPTEIPQRSPYTSQIICHPICYDKKTDCLLIGNGYDDSYNYNYHGSMGVSVIEQYSLPTGRLVRCIAQCKEGVPLAIALSGDGSKLAVAINKKVILYYASV